ncbi:mCG145335, partial [Mus musculus]
ASSSHCLSFQRPSLHSASPVDTGNLIKRLLPHQSQAWLSLEPSRNRDHATPTEAACSLTASSCSFKDHGGETVSWLEGDLQTAQVTTCPNTRAESPVMDTCLGHKREVWHSGF